MVDEFDKAVVSVRADTGAFARDVAAMRAQLDGTLVPGAERAGTMIENALARAVRTGKFGFEDLKRVALSAMAEIAQASLRAGIATTGLSAPAAPISVAAIVIHFHRLLAERRPGLREALRRDTAGDDHHR